MREYRFNHLWTSSFAPSLGIMAQARTGQPGFGATGATGTLGATEFERPFFYTPVYVLYDAILAVRALHEPYTAEQLVPILFTPKVNAALAALVAAGRDKPSPESHFPGPEASFFSAVVAMRAEVPRPTDACG